MHAEREGEGVDIANTITVTGVIIILVPRSSVSFGHVVGETEALVSAVTGCLKIPDIHSLIRAAHSFFISQ